MMGRMGEQPRYDTRCPDEFIIKIRSDVSELLRVQGQVNAMMLAALDDLRKGDVNQE